MKRTLIIAVGLLVLIHALVLVFVPSVATRIVIGNLIRFTALAVTLATLVSAYRRTAGFVRFTVAVLGAAFVPAIIRIVLQAFFDLHRLSGFLYFLLLVLYIVPAAAVLLIPERVTRYRDLRPHALDVVQLGIALGSFFFLFYYPLHPAGATAASLSRLLEIRNYAMLAVLPIRILLSRRLSTRDVLMRLFIVILILQFDLLLEVAAGHQIGVYTGTAFDLLGTVTMSLFPVLVFGMLPASNDVYLKPEGRPLSFTLRAHVVPAVLPAAVWLMAMAATHENRTLAMALAIAAALCYGARWYVVQHQASLDALHLWRSERRLRSLADAFSQRDRDVFFQSIACTLSQTVGARYALIVETIVGQPGMARTLAVAERGKPAPPLTYSLLDTPCDEVMTNDFCHFERGVAKRFPKDKDLVAMGAESYMGMRLHGPSGAVLGLLILIHDAPLPDPEAAHSMLRICSTPVGIEIERWRAEDGLRSTERQLALAFKQSPNGVAIIDAVTETYQEVNESFAALYGAPRESIIGKTSIQLNSWANLDDRARALAELREKGKLRNFEFLSRSATGEIKTVQANADAIQFQGRKLWLVTLRDVTLERAAEKALQQSERKYRDLFQNANDFIFTLDFAGGFLSMNRRGEILTGLNGVESMEPTFEQIIAPNSRKRFRDNLERVREGGTPEVFEVALQDRHGKGPAPVLEVALRLVSQDGQPVAIQGIARDVTDRRVLEKKFLQAQKLQAVGTLAGGIAHDFNNLMTVITGYVHLVTAQLQADSPIREDVEEIGKATLRAASLTRQLLTFSRQQVTHRTPLSLNESVHGMEKMLQRLLGENVQLTSSLQANIPLVMADAGQIDQVILNLAVNARDAMPTGGTLEFRTSAVNLSHANSALDLPAGTYVLFQVIDTGCGMDEATQARVFEPFFTTKEVGKGTGLGLSTVYGIVQDCGGHIGVTSARGRGTTFEIHFPAMASIQENNQPTAENLGVSPGSETILLVEDDASIRGLAAKILETSGYKVLTAGDVSSARAVLDNAGNAIDLMVTDVMIPGGSGVELAEHAGSIRPKMKSFYISGNPGGKLPAGAILLPKPFSPIELAVRIRTVLDESRLEQ